MSRLEDIAADLKSVGCSGRYVILYGEVKWLIAEVRRLQAELAEKEKWIKEHHCFTPPPSALRGAYD